MEEKSSTYHITNKTRHKYFSREKGNSTSGCHRPEHIFARWKIDLYFYLKCGTPFFYRQSDTCANLLWRPVLNMDLPGSEFCTDLFLGACMWMCSPTTFFNTSMIESQKAVGLQISKDKRNKNGLSSQCCTLTKTSDPDRSFLLTQKNYLPVYQNKLIGSKLENCHLYTLLATLDRVPTVGNQVSWSKELRKSFYFMKELHILRTNFQFLNSGFDVKEIMW